VCWPDSDLVTWLSLPVSSRTAAVASEWLLRNGVAFSSQLGIATPLRFRRGSDGSHLCGEVGLQTLWGGVRDLNGSK